MTMIVAKEIDSMTIVTYTFRIKVENVQMVYYSSRPNYSVVLYLSFTYLT
jgi:hypothetical protein